MDNLEINSGQIDKINKINKEEKKIRIKNLELFNSLGFPNRKSEDWKFSDFKNIVDKNFDQLDVSKSENNINKVDLLEDFECEKLATGHYARIENKKDSAGSDYFALLEGVVQLLQ